MRTARLELCHSEQRQPPRICTLVIMKLEYMKTMIAGGWLLGACVVAVVGHVASIGGAAVLLGLGVLPPLVLLWTWNHPAQTMSESISAARR